MFDKSSGISCCAPRLLPPWRHFDEQPGETCRLEPAGFARRDALEERANQVDRQLGLADEFDDKRSRLRPHVLVQHVSQCAQGFRDLVLTRRFDQAAPQVDGIFRGPDFEGVEVISIFPPFIVSPPLDEGNLQASNRLPEVVPAQEAGSEFQFVLCPVARRETDFVQIGSGKHAGHVEIHVLFGFAPDGYPLDQAGEPPIGRESGEDAHQSAAISAGFLYFDSQAFLGCLGARPLA